MYKEQDLLKNVNSKIHYLRNMTRNKTRNIKITSKLRTITLIQVPKTLEHTGNIIIGEYEKSNNISNHHHQLPCL